MPAKKKRRPQPRCRIVAMALELLRRPLEGAVHRTCAECEGTEAAYWLVRSGKFIGARPICKECAESYHLGPVPPSRLYAARVLDGMPFVRAPVPDSISDTGGAK